MLKHLAMAVSMSAMLAGGAMAQAPAEGETQSGATRPAPQSEAPAAAAGRAADPDQCLKDAIALAQSAEQKNLSDDKLDKVEQMLAKMEDHCDAAQFSEAQAMVKDIEAQINAQ